MEYVQPKDRPWEFDFQAADHRPWPIPARAHAVEMSWHDLLFAHWALPPDVIRPLIPQGLPLDIFDGKAWLGVVPFGMSNVRVRGLPRVPGAVCFPELNVRTYITRDGKPGIYFFSLDTVSLGAVAGARTWFKLLYYHAHMKMEHKGDWMHYSSRRWPSRIGANLCGQYRPAGPVYRTRPDDLDHWLTERYCLYSSSQSGRLYRADVHHKPWPLQPAEAQFELNTMTAPLGLTLPPDQPLLHYAEHINVVAWSPERLPSAP